LLVGPIDHKQSHAKAQFCWLEYEIKFETWSGNAFMLKANKMFHCIVPNQSGNIYGVAFLDKTYVLNHLRF
jgi:hypothetical protein